MAKVELVSETVNELSVLSREVWRECHDFALTRVILEHKKLGKVSEHKRIVHVEVYD